MRDNVITLLERLHAHRPVIAEAYHRGSVLRSDENRRAVEALHQHRVLVPHTQDEYRLHSTLRRFLDATLNTQRMIHGAADIGVIFARIEALVDSYVAAFHEGAQEEADACEDEIAQAVFEITDSLQAFMTNLQASIDTKFAAVSSTSAKRRQNEYYLESTHRLVETLKGFHFSDVIERVEPFERLALLFRTQLVARLPVYRDALQSIYTVLRQFLFEYRRIEERAKRLRLMWLHLKRNPDYQPRDWDATPQLPEWLERTAPLKLVAYPDVSDPASEAALTVFAQALAPGEERTTRRRQPGALVAETPPPEVRVPEKPHASALRRMLREARTAKTPFSVRQWRTRQAPELQIDDALWLELTLDVLSKGARGARGTRFRVLSPPAGGAFSGGNLYVRDIELGT